MSQGRADEPCTQAEGRNGDQGRIKTVRLQKSVELVVKIGSEEGRNV